MEEVEIGMRTTERNPLQSSVEDLDNDSNEMAPQPSSGNALNSMVTKVPQADDGDSSQQDLHKQHFVQTVQALQFIKNNIRLVEPEEMEDLCIDLPPPQDPDKSKSLY